MNRDQLKQRIVGAIVLVALGVIFIPMILNRDDNNSGITGTNIPPKPPVLSRLSDQSLPDPPPVPAQPEETRQLVDKHTPPLPQDKAAKAAPESAPAKPAAPAVKHTDKTPVATAKPVAKTHGWVVQIASFSDRHKALRLRDRLRKAKYTCFVEAVTGKHGTLYRVRVGPVIKRAQADRLQAKIARQLKLKDSLVMSYP